MYHTKNSILKLLETNDKAVCRALVALNKYQTVSEQAVEQTRYLNGEGFTPGDAPKGTGMAKFYERRGYLTEKQIAYWRKRNRNGRMRIGKYAGQLARIANSKRAAENKAKTVSANRAILDDIAMKNQFAQWERAQEERAFMNKMNREMAGIK